MTILWAVGLIVATGMVGGLINALLADQGLIFPKFETLTGGHRILRPGFVGNILIGGVTAIVLAGLYSPLGAVEISAAQAPNLQLTFGSLAGALLSGIGGARLLTQEVDKRYIESTGEKLVSTAEEVIEDKS